MSDAAQPSKARGERKLKMVRDSRIWPAMKYGTVMMPYVIYNQAGASYSKHIIHIPTQCTTRLIQYNRA